MSINSKVVSKVNEDLNEWRKLFITFIALILGFHLSFHFDKSF